jgi:HlyD family secretion protein
VSAGRTVLVQLQPSEPPFLDARARAQAEAAIRAAQSARTLAATSVREAQAEFDHASSELRRIEGLAARDIVSQMQLEEARLRQQRATTGVETAQAAVSIKDYELQTARMLLAEFPPGDESLPLISLRAPITGRVLRVFQQSEIVVAPGTPLLEVGDPARLEIIVDLLSADAARVSENASASITDWGGELPLSARVRRIEPSGFTKVSALGVEEQRVAVLLDILDPVASRSQLGDGFRVNAAITLWEIEDAIRIPQPALFREDDAWAAFVLRGNRAERVTITIGRSNDREAEALQGVAAGEQVIVHPSDRVRDGVRVARRPE